MTEYIVDINDVLSRSAIDKVMIYRIHVQDQSMNVLINLRTISNFKLNLQHRKGYLKLKVNDMHDGDSSCNHD